MIEECFAGKNIFGILYLEKKSLYIDFVLIGLFLEVSPASSDEPPLTLSSLLSSIVDLWIRDLVFQMLTYVLKVLNENVR